VVFAFIREFALYYL